MTTRRLNRPRRLPSTRLALEPRIVFDGAMPVAAAAAVDHHPEASGQGARDAEATARPAADRPSEATHTRSAPTTAPATNGRAPFHSNAERETVDVAPAVAPAASHEIVFVDAAVQDVESYLPGFKGQVITLAADSDGLDQIAAALAGRTDVTAIHIISHGAAGELFLGNTMLDTAGITGAHAADIAAIKGSLAPQGDLLLYGCDIAAGDVGQAFITALARATSADVAASTDDTGAPDLGGDWTLEARVGDVETKALDAAGWEGLLTQVSTGTWTVTGNGNATQATSTAGGVTATVSFSAFSTGNTDVTAFNTTGAGGTLNNIAAFSPAAVQNTPDLGFTFDWDNNVTGGGNAEAAATAGTAMLTISFSSAVTNPIIHLDRIGGTAGGLQNGMRFTLVNPGGLSLTRLAGSPHFAVDTTAGTIQNSQIDQATGNGYTTESSLTPTLGSAAGSVQVNGTVTSVSFVMSAAPNSNQGTGGDAVELKVTYDPTPVAVNDSFGTPHDTPIVLNVKANDSDLQNDALTVTKVNGSAITAGGASVAVTGGAVALNSGGNLVFSPTTGYVGSTSFTYAVADPAGSEGVATVTGTVTDVAPEIDLNSGSTPTERVTNGTFTGGALGWIALGTTGTASNNVYYWDGDSASATLTQAGLTNVNVGYGTNNAAQVTFGLGWNDSTPDTAIPATLNLSFAGTVYARLTTSSDDANGTVGAVTYLNGASGPTTFVNASAYQNWTYTNIVVNLPSNVAASGTLQFAYAAGAGGGDDIAIDNVSVKTRTDAVAGDNYTTSYTENAAPVTIAASTAEARDNDNTNLASATIVLTNPQAGDVLSVIGSLPSGITASAYNTATGTLVLTGSALVSDYSLAIRAIGFAVASDNPSTTTRVVNVTTNDGITDSAVSTSTITVTAVNDPPVANNDSFTTNEDTVATINVRANDADPDDATSTLTITKVNGTAISVGGNGIDVTGGVVTLNSSGNLVYSPTRDYNGSTSFTYTLADPSGATSTATVSGTITPVNDPPIVNNNSNANLLIDGDFENTLQPNIDANNLKGTTYGAYTSNVNINVIHVDGNGYAAGPDRADSGVQYIDLQNNGTLSQSFTLSAAQTISFGGTFANRDLGSYANPATVIEILNAGGTVVATASPLTLTRANGSESWFPVTGSASLAAGTYIYRVTMGDNAQVDTVFVRIGPNYATSYTENGVPVSITASGNAVTDVDNANMVSATIVIANAQAGDILSVIGTLPTGIVASAYNAGTGTLTLSGSATKAAYATAISGIGYSSTSDNPGSVTRTVNVTVNDGAANSSVAVTSITVIPVNDPPVAVNDSFTIAEDSGPVTIDVRANDSDPDDATSTLTITKVNNTAITAGGAGIAVTGGVVTLNASGNLVYAPNPDYNGSPSFTYTIADPSGLTSTATVNGTVTPVNDAPTSTAPSAVTSTEDTTFAFSGGNALTVSDIDSPNLTVSLSVGHGTLTLGTTTGLGFTTGNGTANAAMTFSGTQAQLNSALATLSYRPSPDYNGSDTLGFNTSDGSLTATKSIALTITPVADIKPDSVTTNENAAITFNAITGTNGATADTFSDPSRAVTSVTQGAHGSVSFNANGALTYTPNANYSGTDSFNYTVTAGGTTETATETVTINFVNQAPTSTAPAAVTSSEDTTLGFTGGNALSVADVDSANLTVTLNVTQGTLTLGTTTGLTFSTGNGTANTTMTFSGTQAQLNNALSSLSFRPGPDYNGSATLGFATSDGSLTTSKSIALTVTPVADIKPDSVTTNENAAITFNAITGTNGATADTFSDPSRAVTSVTQGAHGSVGFNANGALTYTPNANYSGTDTFNYTVTAGGTTETATETVTINFVNQAPTSTAPAAVTSSEDTTLGFTGGNALTVSDVDSPTLTVSLNVGHGTLTLGTTTGLTFTTGNGTANTAMTFSGTQAQLNNALSSLSFRPGPDYNGSDTLNFTTSDGSLTATKSIALTVTPVADITADSVTTNENAAITFNAITGTNGATADTFSDPSRAVTSVTQGAHGSVGFNANGALTYTPNANYSGTDTFNYTVTAGGTTETATETVTINFVNQAPTSTAPASVTSSEDTTLGFTGGNALTVSDVDSASLTVSLNVTHGTLTLGTKTGLTFSTGNGTANAAMTFSGTQAQLNSALASLSFRPSPDFNGSDTLTFATGDGSLTTTKSVALTITPVADITADNVTTNQNVAVTFNALTGTNGATADTFSDPSRTVTAVTQGAHGSVSFNANGALTYTPNTNYSGTDTFNYTVTAGGTTETATETVTIGAVNQSPTSTAPTSVTSAEDTTFAFTGGNALTASDVDSPNLTVSLNVGHGTLTLGTTTGLAFTTGNGTANASMTFSGTQAQVNSALASLSFRPSPDFNGSDTLSFATSDGSLTATKSVALTITPVPDITADNVSTNQNVAISFNAITGTNGATADTFSDPTRAVTSVTQGANGTVSFNASGLLTYTPNVNFNGTDTFNYTVTAGGTTETATETVTIGAVDQAPTSVAPVSVTSAEDATLAFTGGNALTVSDVDNPNLTVSLNVGHGTLTLGTTAGLAFTTGTGTANAAMTFSGTQAQLNAALASLSFSPNADFNGSDTLNFATSDGTLTATKSVALTITPVTDITADNVTTNQNVAVTFNAITGTNGATADTFSDPSRAVTSVTQGAHGSVSFNANGALTYTPNANYSGTDTFNYTVTAGGTTETATETVTIGAVNQAPTSTAPASVTSSEDATLGFTGGNALTVSDIDSPTLTVSLNVGHGTLTLGTTTGLTFTTGTGTANTAMTFSGTQAQLNNALSSLSFRPSSDYNGSDTLAFTTSDGSLTATKSVALTITPVADITADNVTTNQNVAVTFNAITGTNGATADNFSDPSRGVTSVTQGAHGSVSFNPNGALTYTPNANYSGTDTFNYTVTAGGTTETATETVTIGAVNQAPASTAPSSATSAEDTTLAFTGGNALTVSDVDSPTLTVSLNVGHGTLTLGTTTGLTFTTGNGTANAAMTFSGTQAQLNAALASLSFRPAADYNGSDTLGFSTSDGSLTATKSIALTITPVADITADSVTTNENAAITFNALTGTNGATADTFSDPSRSVTSVTQGAHGSVGFNANGALTYTPNTNYSGTDTFNYTVTAGGTTETATETVTINFVNQAPTSTAPAAVNATEDTVRNFRNASALAVSDVDSANLTVSLNVGHGTLTLGTTTGLSFTTGNGTANTSMTFSGTQAQLNNALASLTYLASPDYNGGDTLNFTTSDGSLNATKSIALTIAPVADITADSVTTNENAAITFNALTGTNGATADTFSDPSRSVTSVTQGAHGSVGFNANGALTYTPNANYSGTDTFSYTVTSGGTTETATETVTVAFVDQAPTSAAPASVTSSEDTTLAFTAGNALTVSDVDNPSLTVTLTVGHGTLTLGTTTGLSFTTGTGTANAAMTFSGTQAQLNSALASLTFQPNPDFNGSDTLNFTTGDGSLTATKTIALTITPVADIRADSVTTNENAAITFNALTGTNGATPDTFSDPSRAVTSVTQGAHGTVSFNANGALTYTPNANFSGTDTFNYTVTAGGTTETATETVTVAFVNQAPTTTAPAAVTSAEDTTVGFTGGNALTVSDVDTPNLTVSLDVTQGTLTLGTTTGLSFTSGTGIANASMTFSGTQAQLNAALASLSFRPKADYNGSDTLNFTTSDGTITAAKSIALTITPVADITADSVTTNENTAISFNAITGTNGATPDTFSDPGRIVTSVTQGLHGTVTFTAAGVLTYTPNASFFGSDSYSYTVSAGGSSETAAVSMMVVHVNQAPVASNDSFTIAEDAIATINVRANDTDVDGDTLTVIQVNGQAITAGGAGVAVTGGTITLSSSGDLVYTPTAFYRGSTSFGYTVADPSGATSTATVSGTITPVNHAPVATDDAATIDENSNTSGNVLANDSDPDGDALTVSAVNGSAAGVGNAIAGSNGGLFTIQPGGTYAFATNGQFEDLGTGQSRTTTISYTTADGQGGKANATITVTVTGVNDAPVANADTFDTTDTSGAPAGLPLSNNVLTNDTDAEHDTLGVSAVNGSALQVGAPTAGSYGTLTLNADGTFSYAVDRTNPAVLALLRGQAPLTDQFTYTAADGNGGTGSTTLTVRVQGTNDGPIAGNDGNALTQGQGSVSGNVITGTRTDGAGTTTTVPSASDTDPGFTLNVSAIRLPNQTSGGTVTGGTPGSSTGRYGTLTIDANGNYTYALNNGSAAVQALVPGQPVTEKFVYLVTDGVHSAEATITVSINGRNDPPIAQNDSFTTAEGSGVAINVRGNDSDPDLDPIRVTAVDGTPLTAGGAGVSVTGGVVTLNGSGDLVYTPATYYRGSPSFAYTIEDPSGAAATATVSGVVTPVNHAPTAVADTFGTLQNTAATINVVANDSDVDGDAFSVTQVNGNAVTVGGPGVAVNGGVVTLTGAGNLVFTPTTNFTGATSFSYTITDPSGAPSTAAVSGSVAQVNQPPVAVADQFTSPQNTTATIDVRANDSDPDGNTLTITQVNGTPITAGGAAVAVTGGTVILDGAGKLEFTPTGNFRGSTSFSYTVSDPFGATGTATVGGTVTAVNHPPVAASDSFFVAQGSVATIDARANDTDADGDPLTVTQVNGTPVTAGGVAVAVTGGAVALDSSGYLIFTPTAGYIGSTTFNYVVADPSGATSTASIDGTVSAAPNHAPVANPDRFSSAANTATTIDVRANDTDVDGDTLVVTQINGTAIGTVGAGVAVTGGVVTLTSSGNLVFTPTANFAGATSFSYTIRDPFGATGSATVSGTVAAPPAPPNHAPVAVADAFTISTGTVAVVDVRANDADVDGDALTVTQINGVGIQAGGAGVPVTGGTVSLDASGRVVFTPTTGYAGTTAFTYTVTDPSGASSSAAVNGTVTRGLHAPVAVPDTVSIPENAGPTIVDVRGNDIDANQDPLTITQIDGKPIVAGGTGVAVAGGVVTLDAGGNLVFTPKANVNGPVSFGYTISDPSGSVSGALVSVAIVPVARAPVAVADTFTVPGNSGPVALNVRGNDIDVDNKPLTITQINGTAIRASGPAVAVSGGSVMLDASGNLLFTPTASTNGPIAFSYTISDPAGSTSTAGVSVNVTPVARAPVAIPDTFTIAENAAATVLRVRSNDVAVDNNVLTITQINGRAIVAGGPGIAVAGGVVNLDVAGKLLFLPTADFNGPVTFSYTISDPAGSTSTAAVSLNVVPLDIGPLARPDGASGAGPVTVDVLANDTDATGTIDRTSVQLGGTARPGDPLVITGQGTFTIDPKSGAITFTPVAGFTGTATATYTVSDNNGARSNPAPLSVTTRASNHAPVAAPDSFTVAQDASATISVLANDTDADGDALTITQIDGRSIVVNGPPVVTAAGSYTLDAGGNIHFVPVSGYNGPASFTYTVRDPSGATSTASVGGSVTPVGGVPASGGAPVATADVAFGEPGTPITIAVLANDRAAPGDPIRVTAVDGQAIAVGGPGVAIAGGVLTLDAGGNLHFFPDAISGLSGRTSFSYTITSRSGASSSAVVELDFDTVAHPPITDDRAPIDAMPAPLPSASSAPSVILQGVDALRSETALLNVYSGFTTDVASQAGIAAGLGDGFTLPNAGPLARIGLIPRDANLIHDGVNAHAETLFVQHAVRYEDLTSAEALFVQQAVRQAQAEAQLLELRAEELYDATLGGSTFLDPFAVRAPEQKAAPERPAKDRGERPHQAAPKAVPRHHDGASIRAAHEGIDLPSRNAPVREAQSGFTGQLKHSARGLRAIAAVRDRHAATVIPREKAPAAGAVRIAAIDSAPTR